MFIYCIRSVLPSPPPTLSDLVRFCLTPGAPVPGCRHSCITPYKEQRSLPYQKTDSSTHVFWCDLLCGEGATLIGGGLAALRNSALDRSVWRPPYSLQPVSQAVALVTPAVPAATATNKLRDNNKQAKPNRREKQIFPPNGKPRGCEGQ